MIKPIQINNSTHIWILIGLKVSKKFQSDIIKYEVELELYIQSLIKDNLVEIRFKFNVFKIFREFIKFEVIFPKNLKFPIQMIKLIFKNNWNVL